MTTKYRGFLILPTDPVPPIPDWRSFQYRVASNHMMVFVHRDDIAVDRPATLADCDEWKDSI